MFRKLILLGLGAAALTLDMTLKMGHKMVARGEEAVAAMRERVQETPSAASGEVVAPDQADAGAAERVPIVGSEGDA